MNLKQQLNMKLSQNLVMTQSLQQAIKLLQLSKLELETLIHQELEENPVLEEQATETAPSVEETQDRAKESKTDEIGPDSSGMEEVDVDYFFQDYVEYQNRRTVREERELPSFENTLSQPTSLLNHLTWQLDLTALDEKSREVAEAIIGNLNSDGYLKSTSDEIAKMTGEKEERVEEIRNLIQEFDPIGVASFDLQECLLVQLEMIPDVEIQLAHKIVADHLEHLVKHTYNELAQELGVSLKDVQEALELIRTLDPKPGSKFADLGSVYVEPDVFIVKEGEEYAIILNEENLPKLRINQSYQSMLSKNSDQKEGTKNYIREKMNGAKWLLKSFVQRQRTIYKVVESIVDRQKEFFENGVKFLKPMVLSDVAFDINMHESTVSRVVTNKYVHTPRGVFELKYFFSSGIKSSSGEDVSSLAVKRRIKQIVEQEDSKKPLSDSKIMALLNQEGLKIARRTVAKYREEQNIPPSKLRKSVF
jgi:RNA polymerase sigma-54 factor